MSFQHAVQVAINDYFDDYQKTVQENGNPCDFTEIEKAVNEDLADKGFYKFEIDSIIIGDPTQETSYKFMAYYICLYADWTTIDELTKLIEEHHLLDKNDFDEDDINNIFKQREHIDY